MPGKVIMLWADENAALLINQPRSLLILDRLPRLHYVPNRLGASRTAFLTLTCFYLTVCQCLERTIGSDFNKLIKYKYISYKLFLNN